MKNTVGLFFIGLAMIAGSFFAWTRVQPYEDGIITTGTIVGEIRVSGDDGDTYKPKIEFTTQEGERITHIGGASSGFRVNVGEEVQISYRPSDPYAARNLDASGQWLIYVLGSLGFGVLVLAGKQLRKAQNAAFVGSETQSSEYEDPAVPLSEHQEQIVDVGQTMTRAVVGIARLARTIALTGVGLLIGSTLLLAAGNPAENPIPAVVGTFIMFLAFRGLTSIARTVKELSVNRADGTMSREIDDFVGSISELTAAAQHEAEPWQPSSTPHRLPQKSPAPVLAQDPTLGGRDPFDS